MSDNFHQLDYLTLQSLFVIKNKAFTEALRMKKPTHELQAIYGELDSIYKLIKEKRALHQKAVFA
jgi:hypothetical protein